MAAPKYVQASTGATDATGAFSFTGVAVGTIGDIVILQILIDGTGAISWGTLGQANINNLAGAAGWTLIGTFNVGNPAQAQQRLYIGRRTSASAAPTFTASANTSGDDVYGRMYEFTNVSAGTTLATVIENVTAGSTGTSIATITEVDDAPVTTLGPDRLALNFVGISDDNTISAFAGAVGGDWVLAVAPYADSGGTDAAIGLQMSYVGPAYSSASGGAAIQGGGGTNEQQAQSFASGGGGAVTSIMLSIEKNGSPTDNLIVEFQTDAGGVPSGTVVGTGATIAAASLPVTGWFTCPVSATLSASTTYWIVARRSGARDTSNFFSINGFATDGYANGTPATSNSGTWTAGTFDRAFTVSYTAGGTISGGFYNQADGTDGYGVVGFALIGTTVTAPPKLPQARRRDMEPLLGR